MLHHNLAEPVDPTRVVVLGSSGFVGSAIVARLVAAGIGTLGLSSRDLDLTEPAAVDRLVAILRPEDALVLVSALTPDRGRDIATFMRNLAMVQHVAAALARSPVAHVVNIGSDAVYHDDANPVTERSPCEPSSFHGMMHAARELMLTQTVVSAPLARLRPSLLYGAGDTHNGYGPNRFRRLAAKGDPITLFGEGEEMRDHVFIDDVAEIVRLVLVHRGVGILNVATGCSISFRSVAETVAAGAATAGRTPVPVTGTPRANPITHRHFDVTEAAKAFPTFRYTSFDEGARLTWRRSMEGSN